MTLSPTSLDFGNVLHGTSSASKRITVTNDGDVSANSLTVVTDGSPSGRFTSTNDCPASLGAGASCHVDTTYSPGASDTGNETGSVTVNFSGGNNPSASLSGNAVATAANLQISITPNSSTSPGTYGNSDSANVGSGFVAHSGSTVKVWIKNTGAADAYISNSPVPVTLGTNSELQVFGPPSSTCDVANAVPTTTITFNDLKIAGGAECYIAMRAEPTVDNAAFSASFTITGTPGGSITGSISGN